MVPSTEPSAWFAVFFAIVRQCLALFTDAHTNSEN